MWRGGEGVLLVPVVARGRGTPVVDFFCLCVGVVAAASERWGRLAMVGKGRGLHRRGVKRDATVFSDCMTIYGSTAKEI